MRPGINRHFLREAWLPLLFLGGRVGTRLLGRMVAADVPAQMRRPPLPSQKVDAHEWRHEVDSRLSLELAPRILTRLIASCIRPAAAAALAIPDLAALIFSAYCSAIRVDFHPPACVIAARSISSAAKSRLAPTRVECPLTRFTARAGIPIHCATRLKIGAMLPEFNGPPTWTRPIRRLKI